MSCGRIRHLIQSCVDGSASGAERLAVEAHLGGCTECARVLEESRRLVSLLAAMPRREVSDSFETQLMAAVQALPRVSPGAAWRQRFRLRCGGRLRVPALLTAGALTAAVLAAVVAPRVLENGERQRERRHFLTAAIERHRQLERANREMNWDAWDAMEGSIELSTGSMVTE